MSRLVLVVDAVAASGSGSRVVLARIMLAGFDSPMTGIAAQPFVLTGADGTGNSVMFLACC